MKQSINELRRSGVKEVVFPYWGKIPLSKDGAYISGECKVPIEEFRLSLELVGFILKNFKL